MHGILKETPDPLAMTTQHTYTDYEVVTVAAKERILITINREELPLGGAEQVVGAAFQGQDLLLSFDSGHQLRFAAVPDMDVARLQKLNPILCALENKGVAFAIPFSKPAPPRAVSKPR